MKKEDVEKRLAELRATFEQIKSNGNAIGGAIQDCEYWLEQIKKEEEATNGNISL